MNEIQLPASLAISIKERPDRGDPQAIVEYFKIVELVKVSKRKHPAFFKDDHYLITKRSEEITYKFKEISEPKPVQYLLFHYSLDYGVPWGIQYNLFMIVNAANPTIGWALSHIKDLLFFVKKDINTDIPLTRQQIGNFFDLLE